jgi:hypothetical protein
MSKVCRLCIIAIYVNIIFCSFSCEALVKTNQNAMQQGGECGMGWFHSDHTVQIEIDKSCQVTLGVGQSLSEVFIIIFALLSCAM